MKVALHKHPSAPPFPPPSLHPRRDIGTVLNMEETWDFHARKRVVAGKSGKRSYFGLPEK